jgi:hypothetical protein
MAGIAAAVLAKQPQQSAAGEVMGGCNLAGCVGILQPRQPKAPLSGAENPTRAGGEG